MTYDIRMKGTDERITKTLRIHLAKDAIPVEIAAIANSNQLAHFIIMD